MKKGERGLTPLIRKAQEEIRASLSTTQKIFAKMAGGDEKRGLRGRPCASTSEEETRVRGFEKKCRAKKEKKDLDAALCSAWKARSCCRGENLDAFPKRKRGCEKEKTTAARPAALKKVRPLCLEGLQHLSGTEGRREEEKRRDAY